MAKTMCGPVLTIDYDYDNDYDDEYDDEYELRLSSMVKLYCIVYVLCLSRGGIS